MFVIQDALLVESLKDGSNVRLREVIFQIQGRVDAVEDGSQRVSADVM